MTPQGQDYAHAAIKVFTAADEEPWEDGPGSPVGADRGLAGRGSMNGGGTATRKVNAALDAKGIPRAHFVPTLGWWDGYLAEQIGGTVRVHWFGHARDRGPKLGRCAQALTAADYKVQWATNAAGQEALDVEVTG